MDKVGCGCDAGMHVSGWCYYCLKRKAGLIGYHPNGALGLNDEQLIFVGVVDPDTDGAWVMISNPLSQMLAELPIEPWDRTVPVPREWR